MGFFFLEAALIQSVVPFYRRAAAQETADRSHFTQLDSLRGILALSVFFTHSLTQHQLWVTGKWELPASNFYAQLAVAPVAMFFLITGFLFWSKAQKGPLGGLRTFFLHRIRRLYPAYLFSLLLIGFIVMVLTQFEMRTSFGNLFKSILGYLSFNLIPGPPLNNLAITPLIYANVFWSLRVEWMFYIIFPLMALLARTKVKQLVLLLIAVGIYFAVPALRQHIPASGKFGTLGLGTLEYFDFYLVSYFSIGMIAAFVRRNYRIEKIATSSGATIIAIISIVALVLFVPAKAGFLEGIILGIPFMLIVLGNSLFGLLRLRPLILLGQISYSIYLLHGIVLFAANRSMALISNMASISPLMYWLFTLLAGTAAIVLSAFSYRYLEAPFMKGYGTKAKEIQERKITSNAL